MKARSVTIRQRAAGLRPAASIEAPAEFSTMRGLIVTENVLLRRGAGSAKRRRAGVSIFMADAFWRSSGAGCG
jgi:hypothetical protein